MRAVVLDLRNRSIQLSVESGPAPTYACYTPVRRGARGSRRHSRKGNISRRSSPANIALAGVADSGVQLPRHRTSTCLTFSLWIVRMLDSEHDEGETVTLVNQAYMACISICVAQPAHSNSLNLQIQPFNTTCTFFCIPPPRMAMYYVI